MCLNIKNCKCLVLIEQICIFLVVSRDCKTQLKVDENVNYLI